MPINIGDNFSYLGKKFLDNRQSFDTLIMMNNCTDVPIGFITFCKEDSKRYEYTENGWIEYKSSITDEEAEKINIAYIHSQTEHVQPSELEGLATENYVKNEIAKAQLEGEEIDLSGYATKDELDTKANITDIPINISQLTNDSGYITSIPSEYITENELEDKGYLTEHQDISHLATKDELTTKANISDVPTKVSDLINDNNFLTEIPNEYITENELNEKGYLTEHQDISGKADKTELHNHTNKTTLDNITDNMIVEWNNKSEFDGDYNNLINKPNIPSIEGLATEDYVKNEIEKDLGEYATKDELSNKANILDIPTKVSQLENDNNYLNSIPSEYITETELNDNLSLLEKVETSDTEPTKEDVVIWINTSEDLIATPLARINDNIIASNTTWSSEKINALTISGNGGSGDGSTVDITKTKIEEVLTGDITSHTHSQYLTEQSLGDYITEDELNNKGYATTSQIPTSLPANGGNANTVGGFTIWYGTQSQYNAIATKSNTTIYFIREG